MAKILIVDDAAFMRMMIKDIVTKAGHEVVAEASNGKEAVESYKQHQPDLVTMDITMPEKDGIQALKEIRAFDPNARVIMCSAMGQQEMVLKSLDQELAKIPYFSGATILGDGTVALILDTNVYFQEERNYA